MDLTMTVDHLHHNLPEEIIDMMDAIIIFNTSCNQVVWISKKFKDVNDKINIGDPLESVCNMISKSNESSDILKKKIINLTGNIEHLILEVENNEYDVEITRINKSSAALRFRDRELKLLANSRYLEDREKLLFTSRSITVSEMASTLAHELNQPIGTLNNLLIGIKSRLNNENKSLNEVENAIDKSLEQIKYTSDIITRIRDYTQSRQPKLSTININSLIDKSVSLMDWEIKHANIEFSYLDNTENIEVYGDEVMLQQVIVNLIRNGIDASIDNCTKKTKIKINTKSDDKYIEISIKDNGKGMSNSEVDNIFIPFASNKSSGMGIGLNICRSFIELHKGKLWLSQNSDAGCTSHITLPLIS
jgi:two-component system sensor histidine kinase DctS